MPRMLSSEDSFLYNQISNVISQLDEVRDALYRPSRNLLSFSDFAIMRHFLTEIHEAVGTQYTVCCAWNVSQMKVVVAKPSSNRKPMVMTFDCEEDYSVNPKTLLASLAGQVNEWFSQLENKDGR